jgi:hypothetical protein
VFGKQIGLPLGCQNTGFGIALEARYNAGQRLVPGLHGHCLGQHIISDLVTFQRGAAQSNSKGGSGIQEESPFVVVGWGMGIRQQMDVFLQHKSQSSKLGTSQLHGSFFLTSIQQQQLTCSVQ